MTQGQSPAAQQPVEQTEPARARPYASTIGWALVVGIFYFFVVADAALLLVAVQLRSSAGAPFDTWRLNYISTEALALNHNNQLDLLQSQLVDASNSATWARVCINLLAADKAAAAQADPELAELKKDKTKYEDLPPSDTKCRLRGAAALNADQAYFSQKQTELEAQVKVALTTISADRDAMQELTKGHQEFLAFIEMQNDWYTRPFIVLPYDLLVMFLVVLMGALGGIVRLVRSYLAPGIDDPRLRDYIFIPVIGMVVAIGGYVLAKTGLLLLSSAKEETALSPFMVGLVGIISGLLAKEVIDRITDVGVPMLRGQKGNNAQANAPRAGDRRAIRAPEASLGANPADASPDQAGGSEVMSDDGQ